MATQSQVNQAQFDALTKEGFIGDTLGDKTAAWLRSEGATGGDITGLWHTFWDVKLVPAGPYNDRRDAWLDSVGAAGSQVNDRLFDYWNTRLAAP